MTMTRSTGAALLASLFLVAFAAPAAAHLDPVEHGSFVAGFTHPLFGLDHVLAMVVVGVWAALLGGTAVWIVPAAFVCTMQAGFGLALAGVPLPFVEPGILASIVVLGLLAALAFQVPATAGAAIVAVFAMLHGHAHGGEMGAAGALPYAGGFAVATAGLHIAGLALVLGASRVLGASSGRHAARVVGGAAAIGGIALAIG